MNTEQKYYFMCEDYPEIYGKPEGFNPCPICGKTEAMWITAQKRFEEANHQHGYSITIECLRCLLEVSEYSYEPRAYWDMRADLRQKWNRLGGREK